MEVEKREDSAQKPMQKKRVNISLYKAQRVQPPHLLQVAIFYYWFHIRERIRIGTFFLHNFFLSLFWSREKRSFGSLNWTFFCSFLQSGRPATHINATQLTPKDHGLFRQRRAACPTQEEGLDVRPPIFSFSFCFLCIAYNFIYIQII